MHNYEIAELTPYEVWWKDLWAKVFFSFSFVNISDPFSCNGTENIYQVGPFIRVVEQLLYL